MIVIKEVIINFGLFIDSLNHQTERQKFPEKNSKYKKRYFFGHSETEMIKWMDSRKLNIQIEKVKICKNVNWETVA